MISSSKMLKRSTIVRTIHLLRLNYCCLVRNRGITGSDQGLRCYSTTSPCVNYGRDDANNHRLLQLGTLKAHSYPHFCTSTTTTSSVLQSSNQISNKLPNSIDQQCREWTQIVRAEWEAKNAKHDWHGRKLKCTNVLPGLNTSRMFLSNEGLSPEQWRTLCQLYRVGKNVELKNAISPQQHLDNILGTVVKQFPDAILIRIQRRLNIQEAQLIQQCSFDMKEIELTSYKFNQRLNFLAKRHSDWHKLPGYVAMLQAFKCQPLPEDTGLDPADWVGSHGKDLDPSQCQALGAALNLKRPIVAVHGPPGSGKTHLLAEYLYILSQQGKKVLVLSSANAALYQLLGKFCNKFPSAASNNGTFLCLKAFDAQLASKVIADKAIEKLIAKNSIAEIAKNEDEETQQFYDQTGALKSAIEQTQDFSKEVCSKREAEELAEQMRDIGHQRKDEASRNLLESTSVLFTNTSRSMLNMFTRTGLTFDVVIIDDAALFSAFESWMMALPTAPVLRLFGDYNQPGIPVHSSIGKELNFGKSLLQRLDEQFGSELNFHLRRQYRSNAAIQAWPNRAFYGQRAAEPDESVRDIRLDDLLEEGKSAPPELITDPMVLVDIGQLEGEWREWMFKAEKGGKSWFNWGDAFLAASHLSCGHNELQFAETVLQLWSQ